MLDGPVRILFICYGNLCRSPLAEAVFKHQVAQAGLGAAFEIASAGVGVWHVGDPPDPRMCATALAHGIDMSRQRGRKLSPSDLHRHHLVLAMDRSVLAQAQQIVPGGSSPLALFRHFDPAADSPDVPDPFYGADAGFEEVFAIVERTSRALLEQLSMRYGP